MKKRQRKIKPTARAFGPTEAELNRAIKQVASFEARLDAIVDELETSAGRLHHAAREHEETVQELRRRGVLDREVEKAIDRLKVTFRDGPVQIHRSLVKLAQEILQEQIRSVLRDQMQRIVDELATIAREEIAAEVSAAMRDAQAK